jgi:hypothetical protein
VYQLEYWSDGVMHFILFPTLQYSRSPTWQVLLEPILSMEFRDADYRSWEGHFDTKFAALTPRDKVEILYPSSAPFDSCVSFNS